MILNIFIFLSAASFFTFVLGKALEWNVLLYIGAFFFGVFVSLSVYYGIYA